ncbi:hypothetical protein DBZ36_14795 [Alginatibacterium sediminis]|uniref:EF-hand domain-containing protein n=1 Tax=Alginatibacterium sediminis TaxID=2164068 RepID=A0A420E8B2_9ALTE|nr:hypothetical protein [Alginatibacterium sediminis]RKF15651.1 hypothetical protein DBZ36_14795 [Alginatibacterium sediminis]
MNISIKQSLVLVALLAVISVPTIAAQNTRMANNQVQFEQLDLDGNGFVTQEEHAQFQQVRISERQEAGYPMRNLDSSNNRYQQLDSDNDGQLSADEFATYQQTMMANRGSNNTKMGKGMGGGGKGRQGMMTW